MGGGYDISQSTSESSTQGLSTTKGNFTVGGGGKSAIVWPIALGVVAIAFMWFFFRRK